MHRLTSLDAQFFATEHDNVGSHYCAVAIYDTADVKAAITAESMIALMRRHIGDCPPLRWKLVTVPFGLDYPVFVEVDIDPADHVSEMTLPQPADEAVLSVAVGEDLKVPLDHDRPLWRMRIFHGLPGRTAVTMTLHHGAVDGLSAKDIFDVILDAVDDADEPLSEPAVPSTVGPVSRLELAARGLLSLPGRSVGGVVRATRALGHLDQSPVLRSLPQVQTLSKMVRGDFGSENLHAPQTRFNAKLCGARSTAFGTVSLTEVKAIKRELGATVNDVVLALCAGALRRRMLACAELPAEPLVAYIPVSVRVPSGHKTYGNAISSIIVPIPTHLDDPRERVAFTADVMTRAKNRLKGMPPTLLSDVNDAIPVPVFDFAARGLMDLISSPMLRPPVNVIISNIPGSPNALRCGRTPLLAHYPLSLIFDGLALNMTVVSYQDGLDVGIVGDAEAVPDAWALMADVRSEMGDLTTLVASERG